MPCLLACFTLTVQLPSSYASGLQAKSKKLMWRMNRGIVKDLLPQSPLNIQIGKPAKLFSACRACRQPVCAELLLPANRRLELRWSFALPGRSPAFLCALLRRPLVGGARGQPAGGRVPPAGPHRGHRLPHRGAARGRTVRELRRAAAGQRRLPSAEPPAEGCAFRAAVMSDGCTTAALEMATV